MNCLRLGGMKAALLLSLLFPAASARGDDGHIYWHTSPGVESCSMVIDPSLTQAQWSRFTREAGAIVSFKSLRSAETLGRMRFTAGIDHSYSPVDQHDPAWINTFTHPDDENCPLGDTIQIPTLRAAFGVTDRVDLGGFWTTAADANYGLVGAEAKYAILPPSGSRLAAAVRTSVTLLTGVPDFNMAICSAELLASRRLGAFTPYAGLRESLAVGTETTSKVDLDRETIPITQGYAGLVVSAWNSGSAPSTTPRSPGRSRWRSEPACRSRAAGGDQVRWHRQRPGDWPVQRRNARLNAL